MWEVILWLVQGQKALDLSKVLHSPTLNNLLPIANARKLWLNQCCSAPPPPYLPRTNTIRVNVMLPNGRGRAELERVPGHMSTWSGGRLLMPTQATEGSWVVFNILNQSYYLFSETRVLQWLRVASGSASGAMFASSQDRLVVQDI